MLQNFRLEATGTTAKIDATDLEKSASVCVQSVKVEEEGVICVPAARLTALLRECRDDEVSILQDGEIIRLETAAASFEVPWVDPSAFPTVQWPSVQGWVLMGGQLRDCIRAAAPVTAKQARDDKVGAVAQGLYLDLRKKCFYVVGTDFKEMVVGKGGYANPLFQDAEGAASVPCKAMEMLANSILDDSEEVTVVIEKGGIYFMTPRLKIHSQVLGGKYPAWSKFIPDKPVMDFVVKADDLYRAVRQASIMVDVESRRLKCEFNDDELVLSAFSQGRSRVTVQGRGKGQMELYIQSGFVTDALRAVGKGADLTIRLTSPQKQVMLECGDMRVLLVPMSVNPEASK